MISMEALIYPSEIYECVSTSFGAKLIDVLGDTITILETAHSMRPMNKR